MKWGLIARGENRGLGILTWEVARALRPDKVLMVSMGEASRGFVSYPERYTDLGIDTSIVHYSQMGSACKEVNGFLRGLDVVYSAETFYDWHFCDLARKADVATVCHTMPEFYGHWRDDTWPKPTKWWAPTTWRLDKLPEGTPVVPVPVPTDRWPQPPSPHDGPLRVLHVAGNRAAADRNGTLAFITALRHITKRVDVTVTSQGPHLPSPRGQRHVHYRKLLGGAVTDYWRLYENQDVLILPRRYGGLCLPMQEGLGAGLAVAMTDVAPNLDYPVASFRCSEDPTTLRCAGDEALPVHQPDPRDIARLIDAWAENRDAVKRWQSEARQWAKAHSWDEYAATWRAHLEVAAR